jgi:dTDP-glucose pyrophosphorylase
MEKSHKKSWEKAIVDPQATILKTIKSIDESAMQIAMVVDEKGILRGTVTDGDIRRGILRGVSLDQPVERVMQPRPVTASKSETRAKIVAKMRAAELRHIPVIDDDRHLIRIEFLDDEVASSLLPNWVVIMAGGQGHRLRPLTDTIPKPLLKIGNTPLLETTLTHLSLGGFKKFFLAVNYKAEMIMDHFGDGSKWGVKIEYLREEKELGTVGALGLLPSAPEHPVLVMNGDVLTKVNCAQMLEFHQEHGAAATMGVREYDIQIPYGVVKIDNEAILELAEKPVQRFFVNAGIYIINPEKLALIPKNEYFDMPTLFSHLMEKGSKTAAFPIREYWMDIGQPEDFERAQGEYLGVFK